LPQPAEVPVAAIPEEQPAPMPAERDEGLPAALLPDRPRLAGTARIAEAPPVPLDDGVRSATDAPGGEPSLPEEPAGQPPAALPPAALPAERPRITWDRGMSVPTEPASLDFPREPGVEPRPDMLPRRDELLAALPPVDPMRD